MKNIFALALMFVLVVDFSHKKEKDQHPACELKVVVCRGETNKVNLVY